MIGSRWFNCVPTEMDACLTMIDEMINFDKSLTCILRLIGLLLAPQPFCQLTTRSFNIITCAMVRFLIGPLGGYSLYKCSIFC